MTPTSIDFVKAFKRNCPHVRLTRTEEDELARLFRVATSDAKDRIRDIEATVEDFKQTIREFSKVAGGLA